MSKDKSSEESHILGLFRESARSILKRKGMTQTALAAAMRENYKNVNNWLAGGATPSLMVGVRMAKCLKVPLDELCGTDSDRAKSTEQIREYAERIVVLAGGTKSRPKKRT